MIKYWENFNANDDDIKQIIIDKFNYVTDLFIEIEDMGIITYNLDIMDKNLKYGIDYHPSSNRLDHFFTYQFNIISGKLKRNPSNRKVCISINIKLPGESTGFGNVILAKEGISLLSNIINITSRLDSLYDVKMNLNNGHMQHKPLEVLICFDI